MLNSISRLYTNSSSYPGFTPITLNDGPPTLLEKIDKHLEVLYYRNSQLRNAIIAKSPEYVSKRKKQYIAVLQSYVRLVRTELHESIVENMGFENNGKYLSIRKETFAGYDTIIAHGNLASKEILKKGSDYARELFQMELQIKEYQKLQEEFLYPLLDQSL